MLLTLEHHRIQTLKQSNHGLVAAHLQSVINQYIDIDIQTRMVPGCRNCCLEDNCLVYMSQYQVIVENDTYTRACSTKLFQYDYPWSSVCIHAYYSSVVLTKSWVTSSQTMRPFALPINLAARLITSPTMAYSDRIFPPIRPHSALGREERNTQKDEHKVD